MMSSVTLKYRSLGYIVIGCDDVVMF